MSTSSIWSAARTTSSGTFSCCSMPVIWATTSLRLSRCWTLTVEITVIPASSSSSTSCQRLGFLLPGVLVWASSSTSTTWGWRAQHRVDVEFGELAAAVVDVAGAGSISMPSSSSAVFLRPCVSTTAATTSVPRSSRRCASPSIAYVLPTPGAAPR